MWAGKDDTSLGNSRFEPSWIWLVPHVHSAPDMGDSEKVLDNSLQVEWSKCYAQKSRWEEVLLLQEEMWQVVTYLEWKGRWWQRQGPRRSDVDSATLHGIAAYAEKQAYLWERLTSSSAAFWLPTLKEKGISPEWEDRYPDMSDKAPPCCIPSSPTDEDVDDVDDDEAPEEIDDGEGGNDDGSDCEELDWFEVED